MAKLPKKTTVDEPKKPKGAIIRKNFYERCIQPFLPQIQKALESGASVTSISNDLGINPSSFYEYVNKDNELAKIFAQSRNVQIRAVEHATFQLAQGHKEKVRRAIKTKDGIEYVEDEIYVPPNAQAQQFLLKNLMSKTYKDKVEVEQTIKVDVNHINSSSTEDLLDMLGVAKKDVIEADFVQVDEPERD